MQDIEIVVKDAIGVVEETASAIIKFLHQLRDECINCDKQVEALNKAIRGFEEENTKLRYFLASGSDSCVYCGLSKADQGKCAHGFPGCARADDWLCGVEQDAGI